MSAPGTHRGGEAPATPFSEIVSSLDAVVDAVDLLHRCALVQGGGETVHLLTEASQAVHRAAFALRELATQPTRPISSGWCDASWPVLGDARP